MVPWCFRSTSRPPALKGFGETVIARAPGRPTAREKPVYRAPLMAILTATALLLVGSFRSPPLMGCRTRLLRAWSRAFIWARHCPPPLPSKHSLGWWVCCVQCSCKCVMSCCWLCAPSSFLIRAWDRQWRSYLYTIYVMKYLNWLTYYSVKDVLLKISLSLASKKSLIEFQ